MADLRLAWSWIRQNPLAAAFAISLLIHTAMLGTWKLGKTLGWWEYQATWLLFDWNAKPSSAAAPEPLAPQDDSQKVIPMTFVEVDPSLASDNPPTEESKYYSTQNSLAANPNPVADERDQPAIDGTQDKIMRLADNPRPNPFPLQPAAPPEEPRPAEEETPAKPETTPKQMAKLNENQGMPVAETLHIGETQPAAKPPRPRTLAQAMAQQPTLAGQKTRQEGGVRRRGKVVPNVKITPFGAYDLAFIRAVEQRWYDLLDNTSFVQRSGKVVLDFKLNSDGRITGLVESQNEVGEILGLLCQRAILDPAPFDPWPSEMLRMIGSTSREVTFTFYYY